MMWKLQLKFAVFPLVFLSILGKRLNKAATELLENEDERFSKEKLVCPARKVTERSIANLRFLQKFQDVPKGEITPCVLQLVKSSPSEGWLWSVLGDVYLAQGMNSQANTCFKQAVKLSGKISPQVKEWHFIGPFVIGKTELDGDPVEYFGGIRNISRFRLKKGVKYFSELIPGGEITWKVFSSSGHENSLSGIKISSEVNWNDLVSSLGSMGITEWQGWVVGEFAVNEKDLNIVVQCLGVHTVYVDDFVLTGDVYHREKFWFSTTLGRGLHTLYIRLRTKVLQNFKCSLRLAPSSFAMLSPSFLPDLLDGYLFSSYLSLPVANHHRSKWLRVTKVSRERQSRADSIPLTAIQADDGQFAVAPGQTRPVIIKLVSKSAEITSGCHDIDLVLKVTTTEGQQDLPITLRCRKSTESFLFTFLDHDGSVQHGAAIQPLEECDFKDRQTDSPSCPVLLTLHGTTVPPQNQADSYKHMVNNEFVFGVKGAWLLAPTRHGAHNWEGPGALTAMTALQRLYELTNHHHWIKQKASVHHVIFAGHSMGGHGAWHVATHFPDRALALIPLAGWIKKEEYGDSNLFFKHDISTSHTDPAVKAIMEACIAENDVDRLVSNLQGIPVLTRIGDQDRTVHPFFSRRMFRRLMEEKIDASYTELKGKEHWWWDTWETNDGGAVNDRQLRDFTEKHCRVGGAGNSCTADEGDCGGDAASRYTATSDKFLNFTYATFNPAFGEGKRGVQVLQQVTPFRKSQIKVEVKTEEISVRTVNVAKFDIREPISQPVHWRQRTITIDDKFSVSGKDLVDVIEESEIHFCRFGGKWQICRDSLFSAKTRGPHNLGPARRIAENQLVIITGTQGPDIHTTRLLNQAIYIANLFYLTSDSYAPILRDVDADITQLESVNVIVLGSPDENSLTSHFLKTVPIRVDTGHMYLADCVFDSPRTGLMTLTSHGDLHLGMVIMGLDLQGMQDAVSLATPTIPPMTRSPFSNLLPDFVITGPEFGSKGPGGFECAGFWGNSWEYRADLASCVCHSS
ncbi:LOW QUALITY PROTEIN: uncharacterized protein LOC135467560 [Liolophura sinensis]|uniref:LOW QUALITY PROTEIN: uncharacterized protein LOC135467560 n=1 Tax=Liolophura sinensis TaxID=3198878 RepID=UPI003157FFFB